MFSTGESLSAELGQRRAGDCEDSLQRGLVWRASSKRVKYIHKLQEFTENRT